MTNAKTILDSHLHEVKAKQAQLRADQRGMNEAEKAAFMIVMAQIKKMSILFGDAFAACGNLYSSFPTELADFATS